MPVRLEDIGSFYGGLSGKTKGDFGDGNAKFVPYTVIYNNQSLKLDDCEPVRIGENEKQNRIEYGDILFTGSSETPEECGMSSVVTKEIGGENIYLNSFSFGFRLKDKLELWPNYASHLFRSHATRKEIQRTASGVTRFNVSKEKMKKVTINLPALEYQKEIAAILDHFDQLCHDLRTGLPAEIEKRQKQYKYYRDKLLTFESKS